MQYHEDPSGFLLLFFESLHEDHLLIILESFLSNPEKPCQHQACNHAECLGSKAVVLFVRSELLEASSWNCRAEEHGVDEAESTLWMLTKHLVQDLS